MVKETKPQLTKFFTVRSQELEYLKFLAVLLSSKDTNPNIMGILPLILSNCNVAVVGFLLDSLKTKLVG